MAKTGFKDRVQKLKDINCSNKIFGIGFPKTGTTSLNRALEILGYVSLHAPRILKQLNYRSVSPSLWKEMNPVGSKDLKIFKKWDALTNFGEHIYPLLDKDFPNSKFILTIRDKRDWLKSTKNYFGNHDYDERSIRKNRFDIFNRMHIYQHIIYREDYFSILYDNHIRNIKYYFRDREQDLLIMDICDGEGWSRLCPFLKKDIPKDLFPKLNKSKGSYITENGS
jgi:hypothetical protein